jgi:hypothetical protein
MKAVEKANAIDFISKPFALTQQLGEGGKGEHRIFFGKYLDFSFGNDFRFFFF